MCLSRGKIKAKGKAGMTCLTTQELACTENYDAHTSIGSFNQLLSSLS
jgi:hypothetical protein